jgi:tRNA pseudouridine65 synthase
MEHTGKAKEGDTGGASLAPKDLPLGRGVRVLAWDANGLLALEKPEKVLSHPNSPRDRGKALLEAGYDLDQECYSFGARPDGEPCRVWLLNRLDSATSGVILAAVDPRTAAAVRKEFAASKVLKTYCALVFGVPRPTRQQWKDALKVERREGKLRTRGGTGDRTATAAMVLRRAFPGRPEVSLLELTPGTGRTHQLRVQCARRKLPIIGDRTYGDFAANREFARRTGCKRLFLHCIQTSLTYRLGQHTVDFTAASVLPEEFEGVVGS